MGWQNPFDRISGKHTIHYNTNAVSIHLCLFAARNFISNALCCCILYLCSIIWDKRLLCPLSWYCSNCSITVQKREQFEDTKGVIRSRNSEKDRYYNGKKRLKNEQTMSQNTTHRKLKIEQNVHQNRGFAVER